MTENSDSCSTPTCTPRAPIFMSLQAETGAAAVGETCKKYFSYLKIASLHHRALSRTDMLLSYIIRFPRSALA